MTHTHTSTSTHTIPGGRCRREPAHTGARRADGGNNRPRTSPQWSVHARGSQPKLSHVAAVAGNAPTAPTTSMPAGPRPRCILCIRDLRMLALGFRLCRWSAICWHLLVVYYRIAQISRLNLACAGPLPGGPRRGNLHAPHFHLTFVHFVSQF